MTTREDCMSEMQKQFEQFCINLGQGLDLRNTSCGFEMYTNNYTQKAWKAWQACAANYEAKIALYEAAKLYDEAPDDAEFEPPHPIFQLAQERDNYAEQIRNLLALIAEKDKALRDGKDYLLYLNQSSVLTGDSKLQKHLVEEMLKAYKTSEQAVSLTRDSVRLVAIGKVVNGRVENVDDMYGADLFAIPAYTKLYTIVKGE